MGWAAVLALALVASGALAFALPGKPRAAQPPAVWDVPRVAQTFMPIVGALAGFSVASTIFIANLTVTRQAPGFPSLIGMFVIAFVTFVGAAQGFGTTPNLPDSVDPQYAHRQRLAFLLSIFGYFIALALSWNALRILLLALALEPLADVLTWVLLFAVVAGATRLAAQYLYMLTVLPRASCLAPPAIGFLFAATYRLILVPLLPGVAAPPNEPFLVAVACFAVAAVGFGIQSMVLSLHDWPVFATTMGRTGDRVVMAQLAVVSCVVGVLWIVVALA